MKIELSEEQIGLILDGLNALAEAAESENRATTDMEVMDSNDTILRDTAELYEHIANNKREPIGYVVVDFDGTGMLEIQRNDEENVFPDDEAAVEQAVKDGIAIIPVDELPENFSRRYYGWIDTPENRNKILKFCEPKKTEDQQGVCPVCGGELRYTDNEQMDGGGVHHWICKDCEATGKEGYEEVFDGHHYEVRDADGNAVPGREF